MTPSLPIKIRTSPRASSAEVRAVRRAIRYVVPRVDSILRVRPVAFTVHIYPNFASFGRALWALQRDTPQGSWDTSGNIVHGVLLIAAGATDLRARFAHIYAEWVFDHLSHNVADREPDPAWLYDGLAEIVAARVVPAPACALGAVRTIPVSLLSTAAAWRRVRGSGAAGLEYCEARLAAKELVRQAGWVRVVGALHHSLSWRNFADLVSA